LRVDASRADEVRDHREMNMTTKPNEPENEGHDELLQAVDAGKAAILSDERLPGGRFQVAAAVMGGEFIVTTWHQDERGDWRSHGCVWLKGDAPTRLIELIHSSGYARPLKGVDG
jgi:hypothetical protein